MPLSLKVSRVSLLLLITPLLGGCLPGLAASAVGAAVRGTQGSPESNAHLRPQAAKACSDHAAQYGAVHIIDVEQRAIDRIIVWGRVETNDGRRSFECAFGTQITSFKLRNVAPRGK
jgi:hypothetical protein